MRIDKTSVRRRSPKRSEGLASQQSRLAPNGHLTLPHEVWGEIGKSTPSRANVGLGVGSGHSAVPVANLPSRPKLVPRLA
jgi:hypothetical protein